ncbi:MAG: hypothetical protein HY083_00730 [Gammaproteobacteria bacterium]|nr:hypothetical protein [Gammaproteobacteria bacterium]
MKIFERLLAVVLAVAVGFSPLASAFAASAMAKASHVAHGNTSVAGAETIVLHADHGKAGETASAEHGSASVAGAGRAGATADGQPAAGCAQHDQCSGKCCAACAQCFTAAFNFFIASIETYSVQFPTVLHLDDRLTVAVHNRPPAA